MSIDKIQKTILSELSGLNDWFDMYDYLIDLGKKFESMDQEFKSEENALKGCQSKVWIYGEESGGKLRFAADSDSLITRGMLSLLIRIFNGHSPQEIADAELYIIRSLGLNTGLSPTRANGLQTIVKRFKKLGEKYKK